MCGIAGISCLPGLTPDRAALDAMAHPLQHRGPDGEGRASINGAALVHRRLSIVDLTGGAQPLHDGDAALIANGEVYNDPALRARMTEQNFATGSDCEPILPLYRSHGMAFSADLRGMYAVALATPHGAGHEIVLARDPFGIKPLYWVYVPQGIAFASEPQALLAAGFGRREVDGRARSALLNLQFTTGQQTIFPGINRLAPGETLRLVDGVIVEQRRTSAMNWKVRPYATQEEALSALDTALRDSVHAHLRADVPVGLFLSGGIDSAALLTAMAREGVAPRQSWTARFDVPQAADESAHAASLAQACGVEHQVLSVTRDMVWQHLPQIVACLDDPVADYATIPTWFLAREAARSVKVVLSGEGGDEMFAGYGRYRRAQKPWWRGGRAPWTSGAFARLDVLRDHDWRSGIRQAWDATGGMERLSRAQAVDVAEWLPNDLLLKLDRCLMVHGVEGRTPLLDPVIAACAARMPPDLRMRGRTGKWILRQWLDQHAPHARPFAPKQGFTVPIADWIAQDGVRLGEMIARSEAVRAIAYPDRVRKLFAKADQKSHRKASWTLLFYALWHRIHIEHRDPAGSVFEILS